MPRLALCLSLLTAAIAPDGPQNTGDGRSPEDTSNLATPTMKQQEQLAGSQTVDDGSPFVDPTRVIIKTDPPSWMNEPPWWWLTPPWWIATPPLWSAAAKHTDVSADGVWVGENDVNPLADVSLLELEARVHSLMADEL